MKDSEAGSKSLGTESLGNAPSAAVGSGVKGALDKESEANSVTLWVCVPIYPMTGANGKGGH